MVSVLSYDEKVPLLVPNLLKKKKQVLTHLKGVSTQMICD